MAGPARSGPAARASGQAELPGMPVRLYACTPTRLNTWLDCPRRYRFAYLDRPMPPKGPPWAHNSVGAAVHSALADWWNLPLGRRTPDIAETLVRRRWLTEGFRDDEQAARAADRAVNWVGDYLAGIDPHDEPVGVERTVSAPTARLVLSGRVDRIDERSGQAVIVDYKTGRYVPTDDDARSSLALAVYAVAAQRTLRRPSGRVELHHLPSQTVAVAEHSPQALERKVSQAESIAADSSRADAAFKAGDSSDAVFPAQPSSSCSWCDWRRHCPEGQAAAPELEPWSSVPG
jgi:putative RecB family exonuclease